MPQQRPQSIEELIRRYVRPDILIRATFSGARRGETSPWKRVVVRRIELRGSTHLQVTWFDDKRGLTRNYGPDDPTPADELAPLPFQHAHLRTASETIDARVAKRGQLLLSIARADAPAVPDAAHDQPKQRLIGEDAPFLAILGMAREGVVKPSAQRKYRQINEFIRILDQTLGPAPAVGPLRLVDLGCGNAYLTFAMHHFLTVVRGLDAVVTGVDRTAELIARNNERAALLGDGGRPAFVAATIDDYEPTERPHVVVALHACDTATDDALARGVKWGADRLLVSPCCHHDLHKQLTADALPPGYGQLLRHGVLREQFADVVTDSLRASLLTGAGYAVDVFAFVPIEHTSRNNLIRAVRNPDVPATAAMAEFRALTGALNLRPHLATLLEVAAADRRPVQR